jgi:hypothetical protein
MSCPPEAAGLNLRYNKDSSAGGSVLMKAASAGQPLQPEKRTQEPAFLHMWCG